MNRLRLSLAVALLTAVSACASPKRPDIVLIVIDALRADRVDFYEPQHELTPFLASLGQRGSVFWRAYAQSSRTAASMASLWTSRYPSQHGVSGITSVLPQAEPTLPKLLKAAGYLTGGFTANSTLSANTGFAQGFDHYDAAATAPKKPHAQSVIQNALAWLDTLPTPRKTPVFLYLHFMEPHFPYMPPKDSFDRILSRRADALQERQAVYDMFFIHPNRWQQTDDVTMATLRDMYDGEVLELDGKLRQLFSELDKRGLLANAVVAITADHGEAFLEHGHTRHGETLYNEELHVPLLFISPGQSGRIDVRDPVALIDVAPTLLDFAQAPAALAFAGHSLRPAAQPQTPGSTAPTPQASAVYSELLSADVPASPATLRSVILGHHQLIVHSDGTSETHDLAADLNEQQSQTLTDSAQAALTDSLEHLRARLPQTPAVAPTVALPDETRKRLEAFGYN